jgi:hypothetical protein
VAVTIRERIGVRREARCGELRVLDETARPAPDVAVLALLVRRSLLPRTSLVRIEASFHELHEHEVAHDHPEEDQEEREWQRGEAEDVSQW